jgi:ribosome assembly protein 1
MRLPFNDSPLPNALLDLPTHLPNDIPNSNTRETDSSNEIEQTVEQPVEQATDEADDERPNIESAEPVCIPGTSITLQTEEDIAKWIEERKKNWPTRKNVELKKQQKQQEKKRPLENPGNDRPKKQRTVCKFFQQHKHCKFGNKCKNVHESGPTIPSSKHHYTRSINGIPVLIPKLYSNRQDSALFKNLVQRDQYEHENTTILDFIRYMDKNGQINHDVMKN